MMESLTDELYNKAKEIMNQIEDKGGMLPFIQNGHAKLMLEESAARKQGRVDSGKDVVCGVNKVFFPFEMIIQYELCMNLFDTATLQTR